MTASCRLCLLGARCDARLGIRYKKIDVPCKMPARLIIRRELAAGRTTQRRAVSQGQEGALEIKPAP